MAHERARWRHWAAAVCAVVLLAGPVPAAGALPLEPGPSDQDVADARAAVAAVSGSVASMEVRLAQLGVELDNAWVVVERAAEDYTESIVKRDAASSSARATARQLELAEAELDTARTRLVGIALKSMRTGSSSDQLRAVLEAGGVDELVQTSEALSMLGARTNEVVQDFRAATVVAQTLRGRAALALEAHESAVVASQDALAAAEELQREVETRVADAEAERSTLLVQLAAARDTSVQVERDRQDRLDEERRERDRQQRERERERDSGGNTDDDGDRDRGRDRDSDEDDTRDDDGDRGPDRDRDQDRDRDDDEQGRDGDGRDDGQQD